MPEPTISDTQEQNLKCPFCNESDFDLDGLKTHLHNEDCAQYRNASIRSGLFGSSAKATAQLQSEREDILATLGEHPDSPVNIADRVSAIRDEGRGNFHAVAQLQQCVAELEAERDGATEAVEKIKDAHACYIRRIREEMGMKTPGDGFAQFLVAMKQERDALKAQLDKAQRKLKELITDA